MVPATSSDETFFTELSGCPEAELNRRPPASLRVLYPVVPPAFASMNSVTATRIGKDCPEGPVLYPLSYCPPKGTGGI